MFSALKNNDKVGLLTFCDAVVDYFPPRKGKANVLRLIRQLVAAEPVAAADQPGGGVGVSQSRAEAPGGGVPDQRFPGARRPAGDGRGQQASRPGGRHGRRSARAGAARRRASSRSATPRRARSSRSTRGIRSVRELFERRAAGRAAELADRLKKAGVDELAIRTDEDYQKSLRRFFRMRERRFR